MNPEGEPTKDTVSGLAPPHSVLRDEANFIQNMSQFYNQKDLSDIVLCLDDDKYFAHRFVLAKSSDVFRTMLYEKSWGTDGVSQIELSESIECQSCFDKFLRYLYTAEVTISRGSAVGILCLADKYNVSSLKDLCVMYMIENSHSPNVEMAMNWYPWAKVLNLPTLVDHCWKTISWNFAMIIDSPNWPMMEKDFVVDFLGSSDLVVRNEFDLWKAACCWLLHDDHAGELSEYGPELLSLLRLPQMHVPQLYELERSELATNPQCQAVIEELLSRSYRFRALCPFQKFLSPELHFNDAFYMPREYTDLTVDNVRIQNNLRFGIQVDVKMSKGPVPSENKEADWKITYRKQGDTWQLQLFCHESGLMHGETCIQPSIVIYNEEDQVVQLHKEPVSVMHRGQTLSMQTTLQRPKISRSMAVILKTVAV